MSQICNLKELDFSKGPLEFIGKTHKLIVFYNELGLNMNLYPLSFIIDEIKDMQMLKSIDEPIPISNKGKRRVRYRKAGVKRDVRNITIHLY